MIRRDDCDHTWAVWIRCLIFKERQVWCGVETEVLDSIVRLRLESIDVYDIHFCHGFINEDSSLANGHMKNICLIHLYVSIVYRQKDLELKLLLSFNCNSCLSLGPVRTTDRLLSADRAGKP